MDNVLLFGLFGLAVVFSLLCGAAKHGRFLWFPLSALCAIGGFLAGLAMGFSLDVLLLPLTLLTAVNLLPLLRKEGGDEL